MVTTYVGAILPVSIAGEVRKPLAVSSLRDLQAKQVFAVQNLLFERVEFRVGVFEARGTVNVSADSESIKFGCEFEALCHRVKARLLDGRNLEFTGKLFALIRSS